MWITRGGKRSPVINEDVGDPQYSGVVSLAEACLWLNGIWREALRLHS